LKRNQKKNSYRFIKDDNDTKLFQHEKILLLWKEHFKKHLNPTFEHDGNAHYELTMKTHGEIIQDITREEIKNDHPENEMQQSSRC